MKKYLNDYTVKRTLDDLKIGTMIEWEDDMIFEDKMEKLIGIISNIDSVQTEIYFVEEARYEKFHTIILLSASNLRIL